MCAPFSGHFRPHEPPSSLAQAEEKQNWSNEPELGLVWDAAAAGGMVVFYSKRFGGLPLLTRLRGSPAASGVVSR